MNANHLILVFFLSLSIGGFGQNQIDLNAFVDVEHKELRINQTITYQNTSKDTLYNIYLNDWNHSFSSKTSALAKRFAGEFYNRFHFAKDEDRGRTLITSLKDLKGSEMDFKRLEDQVDVIQVELLEPLPPNAFYTINLNYIIQVPSDTFTRYGITNKGDFVLKYWYISPAIYDGNWQYYSNTDLDDFYVAPSNLNFTIDIPEDYYLTSELNEVSKTQTKSRQTIVLRGDNRMDTKLFVNKESIFNPIETDFFTVVTDISDDGLENFEEAIIADRIAKFITDNLGEYPHEKLMIPKVEYKKDPIYSLNLLPDFIKPYPDHFDYELKLLKSGLRNYLLNVTHFNPRKDYWLLDALQVFYLMKYVENYHPETKLAGKLSKIWGLKSFHASSLDFNSQYYLLFMTLARANLDQPLSMQKDSLLKFNENIASKYKAGMGLKYLDEYINKNNLENSVKEFIANNKFKSVSTDAFQNLLKSRTEKDLTWFFEDYVKTNKKIDYKISKITKEGDSLKIKIKNKTDNEFPITVFTFDKNDSINSKFWIDGFKEDSTITIPNTGLKKVVLNYDHKIPELNPRDNTKPVEPKLFNKPVQFRLIKDVENSNYNQVFLMPLVEYRNIYDGIRLGAKLSNKPFLRKNFNYRVSPQYATNSNSLTGSIALQYNSYPSTNKNNLYRIYYGMGASYSAYAEGLFVRKFTPSFALQFRDKKNLRANKRQYLNFRFVDIKRDDDVLNIIDDSEPNYSVFNIRYSNNNPGLVNFSKWFADFQLSSSFSKLSVNYEFRRLFQNNRQLNIRFFAGTFLNNKNDAANNYFSFALDRPTDYLFDYDYLGRSESSGIFSQQIIIAEGGFKSKLDTPFANQSMATLNLSTSIWKYIHAYGDFGVVKNKFDSGKFVYDSGVRVILVEDYFEIYFPVYSNLGWEIAQPQYSQKIRFQFTVDPKSLFGLFTRRWY